MALTDLQIANMALAECGVHVQLTTLDPSSDELDDNGRAVNVHLEPVKTEVLAGCDWRFARRTAALVDVTEQLDAQPLGYARAYQRPADCLTPRMIWAGTRHPTRQQLLPFVEAVGTIAGQEVQLILTDRADAVLVYTTSAPAPSTVPPRYDHAVAAVLAARIAMPLTMRAELANYLAARARLRLQQAMAEEENSQQQDLPHASAFERARR